jgi:hypothetical protein
VRGLRAEYLIFWVVLVAVIAILAVETRWSEAALGEPTRLTGYLLFGIMLLLAFFNARKRLSMVPLGRASTWLLLHSMGGVFALALYWLHAPTVWPVGTYERVIAGLFYLVTATGILGYLIQRIYPARLTQTGVEVIHDRIPAEVARIRGEAEAIIVDCTRETGSETLARHYFETFAWYFRRPRFGWSYLFGGQRGLQWVRQQWQTVGRYLNAEEASYLDRLTELGYEKTRLDIHHALQTAMKAWLLVHVPLSAALVVMATWHLVLAHVYAL